MKGVLFLSKYFSKEIFASRLSELMESSGETMFTLGEYLHLSSPTVSRYCNGSMSPKVTTIEAIAKKFDVNPAWLMGAEGVGKYPENKPKFKDIPVLGTIAAGIPILCEDHIEYYESVAISDNIDFCLRVKGNSMINARINDGDIVFIRKQTEVENGEIAAVRIDGEEATIKRFYKYGSTIVLRPENQTYEEKEFKSTDKKLVEVIGKVVFVKFNVK